MLALCHLSLLHLRLEEFLPPDSYDGYAEVKRRNPSTTLLTTGEHEYTRWGFKLLLEGKCADLLQPDVTWCGGITEARRIVALASSFDVPIIPHGSSIYSYHLQFAYPNLPMSEFLVLAPKGDSVSAYFGQLFTDEPLPEDGWIHSKQLNKPGFGVTLNKKILRRPYQRDGAQK